MKEMIFNVACVIVFALSILMIAKTKITFDPFSIKMEAWVSALGWMFILSGTMLVGYDSHEKGYLKGGEDTLQRIRNVAKDLFNNKLIEESMETKDWCYIDELKEIEDDVRSFHCDTRDFGCLKVSEFDSSVQPNTTEAEKLAKEPRVNVCLLMHKDEILPWLKSIEQMSGGKAEWRCLNFKGINTRVGWLKYIRFYRFDENMFIVSDSEGKPFDTLLATEENLERDLLNTH